MNILGLSAFYHDSAACLIQDGVISAAAQEERFTRKKHDASYPGQAVKYCLDQAGISSADLDLVAFYENPGMKFNRIVDNIVHVEEADRHFIEDALELWTTEKIRQEDTLRAALNYHGKILFPLHHQSHAASAFFPSPFKSAAILTMDGVGEWMTTTIGLGRENQVTLQKHIDFPHSLGMLYSAFTYFTGFKVNSGEYKLMGLAPYGKPVHTGTIRDHLIDICEDGSFALDMEYFGYHKGGRMITDRFCELFQRRERKPEEPVTQDDMDLARSVQEVCEEVVLKMAVHARESSGEKHLCLAGGVALNCVANGRIARESGFERIWIQPASGDAGGALGAALYAWYQYLDHTRTAVEPDAQFGTYLGPSFSDAEIEEALQSNRAVYERQEEDELIKLIGDLILDGYVVGHFNGRMEFGPRALGNRSILGDARSPEMQKIMNLKIKYRESFRPFAPSVAKEAAADLFDACNESPYMLLTTSISDHLKREAEESDLTGLDLLQVQRSELPAITHVDYSARVQTVDADRNKRFHGIINAVGESSGYPVVINTSFNVRGEPIVCTPFDAYACFMNTEMDYLVLGSYVLDKKKQPAWDRSKQDREFEMD